ncbi:hypothetical protein KC341_g56 [Hortaea werneckii]|nr:hypothetical protein KC341_g56 [Hortaea werneckii]
MQSSAVATSQTQFDHQRSRSNDGAEARLQTLYTDFCIALPMHALRAASRLFTTIPLTWSTTEKKSRLPQHGEFTGQTSVYPQGTAAQILSSDESDPPTLCREEYLLGTKDCMEWHC